MINYPVELPLSFIDKNVGQNPNTLAQLLNKCGILSEIRERRTICKCFHCQTMNVEILVVARPDELKWNCVKCKSRHGKHQSMVGLYRSHFPTVNPNDAAKILIDNLFLELQPTEIIFPVPSIYRGKKLSEVPPSSLVWAAIGAATITDDERQIIKLYLSKQNHLGRQNANN